MLGGGMRQGGVLAAAGIVALETMVDRLAEDHANARRLAEGLARLPGIVLDPAQVSTNIVIFQMAPGAPEPGALVKGLAKRGIKLSPTSGRGLRAVTHLGIEAEDVDFALAAAQDFLQAG